MRSCSACGTVLRPIRDDGECFPCHVRGIGFTYAGGAGYGRRLWNESTEREFIANHVGEENIRNGTVERVR